MNFTINRTINVPTEIEADYDVRMFKNNSGSISIIAVDPETENRISTIARLQKDGTMRLVKNVDEDLGLSLDDNGRITINNSPLRRNANR